MTDHHTTAAETNDELISDAEDESVYGNLQPVADQPTPHANDAHAVEALRGLVQYVVTSLVDDPDQAEIVVEQRGNVVALGVRLPEDELGKVIGRGGRIAKSIRTALMVAGSQHHLRVSLDIDATEPDPDSSEIEVDESGIDPDS